MSFPDKEAFPHTLGNGVIFFINIYFLLLLNAILCYPGNTFPLVTNVGESG